MSWLTAEPSVALTPIPPPSYAPAELPDSQLETTASNSQPARGGHLAGKGRGGAVCILLSLTTQERGHRPQSAARPVSPRNPWPQTLRYGTSGAVLVTAEHPRKHKRKD